MNVKDIELEIEKLPPPQLAELAGWFAEFHAEAWDSQIEEDSEAGRLDSLIAQANAQYEAGKCKPL